MGLRWPTPLGQPQTSDFVRRALHYPFLNGLLLLRYSLLLRSLKKARLMPRRLKTYQTSLGFFDLAVAAPSMKSSEPSELILLNGLEPSPSSVQKLHLFGLWNMGDRMARGLRLRPNAYRTPQAKCLSARRPLWRRCVCFRRLVASLLRGSKPVYAQPIASDGPEVDRVSVRVVTDSYLLSR